jgi:fructose-specific phosphotransferase system IIC component
MKKNDKSAAILVTLFVGGWPASFLAVISPPLYGLLILSGLEGGRAVLFGGMIGGVVTGILLEILGAHLEEHEQAV